MVWFIIFSWVVQATPIPSEPAKLSPAIRQAIQDASLRYQLDPKLIYAIAKVESNFNPKAVSPKGAKGLMQIMKETGDNLGMSHSYELQSHLNAACEYLRELFNRFDSNLTLVLAAYNAGPRAVEKYKGIPPYKETEDYVRKVLAIYRNSK